MFEHHGESLLPRKEFLFRALGFSAISAAMISVSLAIGILGYHAVAHLSWLDSLFNASMILTGMGPVAPMTTPAAKLFASFYALFSGIAFLSSTAVLFTPPIHRLLHHFHLDLDEGEHSTPAN